MAPLDGKSMPDRLLLFLLSFFLPFFLFAFQNKFTSLSAAGRPHA